MSEAAFYLNLGREGLGPPRSLVLVDFPSTWGFWFDTHFNGCLCLCQVGFFVKRSKEE